MSFLSAHPRSHIRTWLFGLVFLASGAILVLGVISYAGFINVRTLSTMLVSKQIAQLADRASTGRTLSEVFAKIDLISRTFQGRDDIIASEGGPLFGTLADLSDSEVNKECKCMRTSFSSFLSAFITACRTMNMLLAERIAVEQKTHHELDELETQVGNALIQSVKEGKDSSHFEQLLALASTYRESLLRLDKMSLSLSSVRSSEEIERWLTPILASVDDLALRLKTISASTQEVASHGQSISADIQDYRKCVSRLADAMLDVNLSLEELNSARQGLLRMMEAEDKRTKDESQQVESEIRRVVRTAQITTLGVALCILILVTWLTVLITKRGIEQPLQSIIGKIGKIRGGDSPDASTLSDIEEWRSIEIALREMWSEIAQANSQLRESEERYRTLFEAAQDGMAVIEIKTGIIVSCNQALCHLVERNIEQIVGQRQSLLHPPQDLINGESPTDWEHRQDPAGTTLEDRLLAKSGKIVPVEIRSTHFKVNGRGHILGVFRDITERRKAEDQLRRTSVLLDTIVDNIPNMIFLKDARDLRFVLFNKAGEELLGYSRNELFGKNDYDFFPKEQADFFTEKDREVLHGKVLVDIPEELLKTRNKGMLTLHTKKVVLLDAHGESEYLLGISEDITEHKQTIEALRKSEEKYRGIFDESVAAIFAFDNNKNFIDSNQAGLDLLGYSREELLHMSIPDVDADPVVVLPSHQQLLFGGRLVNYEHTLRRNDGTVITVLNNSRPLTDLDGNVIGMLSTLIDITEIKRAEEVLKTALQEKEILLREIHHRVKNNMQVVSSLLTLQAERIDNEHVRQALLDSQQRIHAMAMIHETLYGGQNLAVIDLSEYLGHLVRYLKDIYCSHEGVCINVELGKVELSLDQAVPCGLIVNELVTNSFRHAFVEGRGERSRSKPVVSMRGSWCWKCATMGWGYPRI